MERNRPDLTKIIRLGCLVATMIISSTAQSYGEEIIKPLGEISQGLVRQSLVPAIYYGSRHRFNEERNIWALSNEQPHETVMISEISA